MKEYPNYEELVKQFSGEAEEEEEEGAEITTLRCLSAAEHILAGLAEAGFADRQTMFDRQIDNAVLLGLMPDDDAVILKTLTEYGFVRQSTTLSKYSVHEVLTLLECPVFPDLAIVRSGKRRAFAFRKDRDGHAELIGLPEEWMPRLAAFHPGDVWLRWNDGIDRSPYPRRKVVRPSREPAHPGDHPESLWFQRFQPNPLGNNIGDCVVRALAGTLDLTWEESLRMLAQTNHTTVNALEVFSSVLKKAGFVHRPEVIRNGRHLDGKVFCDEMNRQYHSGERVFAFVGKHHAAAVLPIKCSDYIVRYKFTDSWDSTAWTIGDYWVLSADRMPKKEVKRPAGLDVGSRVIHKSFGAGVVTAVDGRLLSIDFGKNGVRRFERSWVEKNCVAAE